MRLDIEIELNNAVFEDDGVAEVARLLEYIASVIPDPLAPTNSDLLLHDRNGNYCGFARIHTQLRDHQ